MDTIILDHQLQETLVFPDPSFPIQYYVDDLHQWAGRQVPLHWHFGYEFFSAVSQDIEVQVGNEQLMLLKGESILITGGQLHSYRLTSPQEPCLCPNIVFSDDVLAPLTSTVFQKYLRHILNDSALHHYLGPGGLAAGNIRMSFPHIRDFYSGRKPLRYRPGSCPGKEHAF